MTNYSVDQVIEAWKAPTAARQAEDPEGFAAGSRLRRHLLQMLSEGEPVTAERVAERLDRPLEAVLAFFERYRAAGGQFDADGSLVGAALSLLPTRHRFRINGRELYTWCALDALFIPGLIETTAQVESACPVTGETIRLMVTPEGVTDYEPAETVLSITIPGLSCGTHQDAGRTGPESDTCSQIHFFSSREAAASWLQNRPGVAILTVPEAYRLAYENWIVRSSG